MLCPYWFCTVVLIVSSTQALPGGNTQGTRQAEQTDCDKVGRICPKGYNRNSNQDMHDMGEFVDACCSKEPAGEQAYLTEIDYPLHTVSCEYVMEDDSSFYQKVIATGRATSEDVKHSCLIKDYGSHRCISWSSLEACHNNTVGLSFNDERFHMCSDHATTQDVSWCYRSSVARWANCFYNFNENSTAFGNWYIAHVHGSGDSSTVYCHNDRTEDAQDGADCIGYQTFDACQKSADDLQRQYKEDGVDRLQRKLSSCGESESDSDSEESSCQKESCGEDISEYCYKDESNAVLLRLGSSSIESESINQLQCIMDNEFCPDGYLRNTYIGPYAEGDFLEKCCKPFRMVVLPTDELLEYVPGSQGSASGDTYLTRISINPGAASCQFVTENSSTYSKKWIAVGRVTSRDELPSCLGNADGSDGCLSWDSLKDCHDEVGGKKFDAKSFRECSHHAALDLYYTWCSRGLVARWANCFVNFNKNSTTHGKWYIAHMKETPEGAAPYCYNINATESAEGADEGTDCIGYRNHESCQKDSYRIQEKYEEDGIDRLQQKLPVCDESGSATCTEEACGNAASSFCYIEDNNDVLLRLGDL